MNKSEGGQHLREDKHVWKHRPNKVCICICKYMLIVCVSFVISIYYIHIMISIRMFKYTYLTWIQHNDIPLSFFSSKMSTSLGKIHNPSQSSVWSLAATFLRKKQSQQNPPKGLSWFTLQEINISHLGKRKIIFKYAISGGYVNSLEGIMVYLFQFKKKSMDFKGLETQLYTACVFFLGGTKWNGDFYLAAMSDEPASAVNSKGRMDVRFHTLKDEKRQHLLRNEGKLPSKCDHL